MLFAFLFAIGAAALFASLEDGAEMSHIVARTTEQSTDPETIAGEFEGISVNLPVIGEKEDRLPIIGRPVKTETIVIPVEVIPYDEVVRATRGDFSRKQFQDRWPD